MDRLSVGMLRNHYHRFSFRLVEIDKKNKRSSEGRPNDCYVRRVVLGVAAATFSTCSGQKRLKKINSGLEPQVLDLLELHVGAQGPI